MSAPVDSDESSRDKALTRKETRLLLAINSSESALLDAMTKEMSNAGSRFDVGVFIDVFRKYTPHFAEILSPDISADSDDESDEESVPMPMKYVPLLSSFAKSKDTFLAAIEKNYKALFKKELKQLNISVVRSYPEELFKCYEDLTGRESRSTSTPLSNACQPANPVLNVEEKMASLGVTDDSFNKMNDVSHASPIVTPTPSNAAREVVSVNGKEEAKEEEKGAHEDGTMSQDASHASPIVTPTPSNAAREVVLENGKEEAIEEEKGEHGDVTMSKDASHASPMVAPTPSNVGREVVSVTGKEEAKEEEKGAHEDGTVSQVADFEEKVASCVKILSEAMGKVHLEDHQDLLVRLPTIMRTAMRAYLDGKPLTLALFIGEENVNPIVEAHIQRLKQIIEPESRPEDTLVHQSEERGEDECRSEKKQEEEKSLPLTPTPLLLSAEDVDFFPELPLYLENAADDVVMPRTGVLIVQISKLCPLVESQLEELRQLDTRNLHLSNELQLEKGRAVVLKSDLGTYCRGIIREKWTRNPDGTASPVKCLLIDYAEDVDVPIEVMYAFPKWTETIHPALAMTAKLQAYPYGATEETDVFLHSEWDLIVAHFNEWKETRLDIDVVSREGDVFFVDLLNGKGDSFTSFLVTEGLVQLGLTRSPSPNAPNTPSHDQLLPSESALESGNSENAVPAPAPPVQPSLENSGNTQSELVNSMTSSASSSPVNLNPPMDIPSVEVPAFGTVTNSEARGEEYMNGVKGNNSSPNIPASIPVPSEAEGTPSLHTPLNILRAQPRKCFVQPLDNEDEDDFEWN